jgi:hypothetical protein
MNRLRIIALVVIMLVLVPCLILPYLAVGANFQKAITDTEWLVLFAEQYTGPTLALLCGSFCLLIALKRKRVPISLLILGEPEKQESHLLEPILASGKARGRSIALVL